MLFSLARKIAKFHFDRYESNIYCDLFSANRLSKSSVCSPKGNSCRQLLNQIIGYVLQESPFLLAKTRSQSLQELFVFTLLKGSIKSYFEAGANDGLSLSNTFGLMSALGSKGLLVEANPFLFNNLKRNRPGDTCLNYALSDREGSFLAFNPSVDGTLYGSLIDENSKGVNGFPVEAIQVLSSTLPDVFRQASVSHVDFLSLDIEGNEPNALKPIPAPLFHCGLIEANTKPAFLACRSELVRLGYQCYHYPFASNELLAIGPNATVDSDFMEILVNQFSC